MNFEIKKINKKEIINSEKPLIEKQISNKIFKEFLQYSLLMQTNENNYIPTVLYKNISEYDDEDYFIIIKFDKNFIYEIKKNFLISENKYFDLTYLIFIIIEKIELPNNHFFTYDIFSILFFLTFFKPIFIKFPALKIYLAKNLFSRNPEFSLVIKKFYPSFQLLNTSKFCYSNLVNHLIFIEADDSLISQINKFLDNNLNPYELEKIIEHIIICQLNKNRIRKLIDQLYRIKDLRKLDFFFQNLDEEKVFFNDNRISPNQKELKLSNIINLIVNPDYSKSYLESLKLINSLKLNNINIKLSPYFEKTEFSINAIIKNKEEFSQFLQDCEILKEKLDTLIGFY